MSIPIVFVRHAGSNWSSCRIKRLNALPIRKDPSIPSEVAAVRFASVTIPFFTDCKIADRSKVIKARIAIPGLF